jgi:hypothetical protein
MSKFAALSLTALSLTALSLTALILIALVLNLDPLTSDMKRDSLFLLAPGFVDNGQREYCPECAELWGLLSYFPSIKDSVDVCYQPISRPRPEIQRLLGEQNQNCPSLVLAATSPEFGACGIQLYQGLRFIDNAKDIGLYYAQLFGTPVPRGYHGA